ncbi:ubiquitin carboxyl-terminal hydrolase 12-like isoform X2 [Punica granatum]|uniref:Ubiquitin carboxyl-terminal hydrolase 12-like isoform X2 n=1 Tax=Punica granatum TaxID=22663 RepID=A0A6P8CJD8_PUNGR|nr:ubiquitin carboxyl-terminal hydrolase 12-like isoform X2 [Punica granatum]
MVDMDDQGVGGLVTHSGSLRWNIRGFSRLVEDKYWSETFTVNGCKWRILIYPKGNKVHGHLSLYLEVAEPERLPVGWRIEAKVCLAIINQYVPSLSAIRVTPFHVFLAEEKDWGLKAFKSLDEVTDCSRGLLVNDTITVEAKVDIYKKNETHAWYKESLENLTGEEEELEMRLEELRSKRTKLISDWGALMSESEEVKSSYVAEQKKIIEVEEQMKKSEEGRARSDTTWARLKDLLS